MTIVLVFETALSCRCTSCLVFDCGFLNIFSPVSAGLFRKSFHFTVLYQKHFAVVCYVRVFSNIFWLSLLAWWEMVYMCCTGTSCYALRSQNSQLIFLSVAWNNLSWNFSHVLVTIFRTYSKAKPDRFFLFSFPFPLFSSGNPALFYRFRSRAKLLVRASCVFCLVVWMCFSDEW